MGVSLNATSGFRPAAQFLVETPLSSAEVRRLYAEQTQSEADESTDIRFVGKRRLLMSVEQPTMNESRRDESDAPSLEEKESSDIHWWDLAPNARGCVMIARKLLVSKHQSQV